MSNYPDGMSSDYFDEVTGGGKYEPDSGLSSKLTREFAEEFCATLRSRMAIAAGVWFEESGMLDYLDDAQRKECFKEIYNKLHDMCGDFPIWGIIRKNEA